MRVWYAGRCRCGRTVRTAIDRRNTYEAEPVVWCRCSGCERIASIPQMTREEVAEGTDEVAP